MICLIKYGVTYSEQKINKRRTMLLQFFFIWKKKQLCDILKLKESQLTLQLQSLNQLVCNWIFRAAKMTLQLQSANSWVNYCWDNSLSCLLIAMKTHSLVIELWGIKEVTELDSDNSPHVHSPRCVVYILSLALYSLAAWCASVASSRFCQWRQAGV